MNSTEHTTSTRKLIADQIRYHVRALSDCLKEAREAGLTVTILDTPPGTEQSTSQLLRLHRKDISQADQLYVHSIMRFTREEL